MRDHERNTSGANAKGKGLPLPGPVEIAAPPSGSGSPGRRDTARRTATRERVVVFADMVGYSALSSTHELATHLMWMDFRQTCLDPAAHAHEGHVIRMLGDGCLLTFPDADRALAWMLDVRARIVADRLGAGGRWQNLSLRFGGHVADVICESGDIYGSGVNLAKRIQERALGDGVLVSQAFVDHLSAGHDVPLRYLGELEYRNIAQPLATHEIVFAEATRPIREETDELPSIAVMPLVNRTGDPSLDWFADGVLDDVIDSLSSLKELRVISRNSTVPLAQRTRDPHEIARILSVRYVLQGSLVGNGERGRIHVSLEDAKSGDTLLAQKREFSHSELFDVQDIVVRQVVGRITPGVRSAELDKALRKPPANFTAYQCTLRALDLMKRLDRDGFMEARDYLERARRLDDQFALPVAWLARWYCVYVGQHWGENRERSIGEAEDIARQAVALDRENPLALAAYGHVRSYLRRDYETALVYFDRSRQLSPSHALTWILSSATLSYLNKGAEAVEHAKMALTLSPNDQDITQFYDFAGIAHFVADDMPAALAFAEMSYAEQPGYVSVLKSLAAFNGMMGNREAARHYAVQLLDRDPSFTVSTHAVNSPMQHGPRLEAYLQGLEVAGIPH